ncbi:MAG: hypothetical protein AB7O52_14235 [Planctomycetota bacterium]
MTRTEPRGERCPKSAAGRGLLLAWFVVVAVCVSGVAVAQEDNPAGVLPTADGAGANPATAKEPVTRVSQDFRARIMLGYSAVFICLIGYLVYSHRRNAELAAEAEFIKQRLEGLRAKH